MKARVLLMSPNPSDATSWYRGPGPFSRLVSEDVSVSLCPSEVSWATLSMHNVLVLQRPFHDTHVAMARMARSLGLKIWCDWDDHLMAVPLSNSTYSMYRTPGVANNVSALASLSDVVTVTTHALAEAMKAVGAKRVEIVPNAWDNARLGSQASALPREKVVAWRGGATHAADLIAYSAPIVALNEKHRDWKWLFIGAQPWPLAERLRPGSWSWQPAQDMLLYFHSLRKRTHAVQIVPLEDNVFNRSKSNIAHIEAMAAGARSIVPGWEAWQTPAGGSLPGSLHYNDARGFYEATDAAIRSFDGKNYEAAYGWGDVQARLFLSEVNKKRLALLTELVS